MSVDFVMTMFLRLFFQDEHLSVNGEKMCTKFLLFKEILVESPICVAL